MSKLHRSREGKMLCVPHATSGAPTYHQEGCDACAEARAKGIIRPLASSIPKKKRGGHHLRHRWIDWELAHKVRAAREAQS